MQIKCLTIAQIDRKSFHGTISFDLKTKKKRFFLFYHRKHTSFVYKKEILNIFHTFCFPSCDYGKIDFIYFWANLFDENRKYGKRSNDIS